MNKVSFRLFFLTRLLFTCVFSLKAPESIPLSFVELFPKSDIAQAYKACTHMWNEVQLLNKGKRFSDFADRVIDQLLMLQNTVNAIIAKKPFVHHVLCDDIEHLLDTLFFVERQFATIAHNNDEMGCIRVLMLRVKQKLTTAFNDPKEGCRVFL